MKRAICLAVAGVVFTIGCSAKEPFKKEDTLEVKATIEAIDPVNRLLSLHGPNGMSTIMAGPEVQNFAQIHVGDEVKVTYHSALAAAITKSKDQAATVI